MEKVFRYVSENDFELLINMYLNEVENHNQRAEQFAEDLIYKLKTIICLADKDVLGTISWDIRGGLEDGVIELVGLGVSENYRKQDIGRQLVLSVINEAKRFFSQVNYKLRVIYLFMERNNKIGHRFYEYMGFREVSIIPALYPHDDAVIWIKYF